MKTKLTRISFILLSALMFGGCATQIGKVNFPESSAGFAPKQTYAVPYDKVWDASIAALEKNRIGAASADKASGIIKTDDIEGPSALIMGGFGGTQSTRYKYNLTVRKQSDGNAKVNILCKIEGTSQTSSMSTQWHDVTSQLAKEAKQLETWLYEQVETGL